LLKLHSGDYINLKMYEPAMRHLIDSFIRVEESELKSAFDEISLFQLIVERGEYAADALPEGIRHSKESVAETIDNRVCKRIIYEMQANPEYYAKMSELLDAIITQRKIEALSCQEYLTKIVEMTRKTSNYLNAASYPASVNSPVKRALFDSLGKNEVLAITVDREI
jgi:type I restriction enzyme R subunit